MFGLFKNRKIAAAHEKITQLVQLASHSADQMGRERAINAIRNHRLISDWNEETERGGTSYRFAFNDKDVADFQFEIPLDPVPKDERLSICVLGGVEYAGFFGLVTIPEKKYVVSAKDTPHYRKSEKAKLLVELFVQHNHALDIS